MFAVHFGPELSLRRKVETFVPHPTAITWSPPDPTPAMSTDRIGAKVLARTPTGSAVRTSHAVTTNTNRDTTELRMRGSRIVHPPLAGGPASLSASGHRYLAARSSGFWNRRRPTGGDGFTVD